MKRAPGESFFDYRKRRKEGNKVSRTIGRMGRWFYRSADNIPFRWKPIEPGKKRVLVSPAVGKRHQGESVEHFKERRRVCNAAKRKRESARAWG